MPNEHCVERLHNYFAVLRAPHKTIMKLIMNVLYVSYACDMLSNCQVKGNVKPIVITETKVHISLDNFVNM